MKPSDFIVEHNPFIAQDADEMHRDNEVQMARSDLYAAADYAIKLHKILRGVSDTADMDQWVMENIAIANENLRTVYEYLNYEAQEQEGSMPAFTFESAEKQYEEMLEEDWKSALAGGALAATMALGGGAAHADEAPRDVPAATAQADAPVQLSQRYTPGVSFPDAYVIGYNGKEYKFAGRAEAAPKGGQVVTVAAGAVGIRGLKPVQVTLTKDGKYYAGVAESISEGVAETVPMSDAVKVLKHYGADHFKTTTNELHFYKNGKGFSVDLVLNPDATRSATLSSLNAAARGLKGVSVAESCDAGATGASSMATGPVGAAPMQRRVKSESAKKNYGNANKAKQPKFGKGVY
jgi:hypothetical protein